MILGKTRPKKSFVFFLPNLLLPISGNLPWRVKTAWLLNMGKVSLIAHVQENSDSACSRLGVGAIGLAVLSQLLGVYLIQDINVAFAVMFIKHLT